MPFDPFHVKNTLDWCLGGAAASDPGNRWIALATGSPTTASESLGPFTPVRRSGSFGAANSPQMSATNRAAQSWTATAACTVIGWNLYNSSAGGSRLAFGTFSSSAGCASGDTFGIPAGALKITLP